MNKVMNGLYSYLTVTDPADIHPAGFMSTYTKSGSYSRLLQKLMANYLACHNPLLDEGTETFMYWESFLGKHPCFAKNMAIAAGKDWKKTNPYTEEEWNLNMRWENQILSRRTKEALETAAKEYDVRSMIELQHLNRGEGTGGDV
jgi:hypothetical protein